MIIQVASDLHLEFLSDHGEKYIQNMDPTDVDVLVLAGDISDAKNLESVLKRIRDRYPAVVVTLGNHEFYQNSVTAVLETVSKIQIPDVYILQRNIVEIKGVKFAGSTLWFSEPMDAGGILAKRDMTDFHVIRGFEPWVYRENRKDCAFFNALQEGDAHVVVTHHLPHPNSISPRFHGDPLNRFFMHNMTVAIDQAKPPLWIHGHTHSPCDYVVEQTRIVANPSGYPRESASIPDLKISFTP